MSDHERKSFEDSENDEMYTELSKFVQEQGDLIRKCNDQVKENTDRFYKEHFNGDAMDEILFEQTFTHALKHNIHDGIIKAHMEHEANQNLN